MYNVTVDDRDQTALEDSPPPCDGSGWAVEGGQRYGGEYRWCSRSSRSSEPMVIFTFTGVSIYYSIPTINWGSIRLTLDGSSEEVDLSHPIPAGSVVWSRTGLENKVHKLQVSPGRHSQRLRVGSFTYTVLQDKSPLDQIRSYRFSLSRRAGPEGPETTVNRIPIVLGSIFGGIVFFVFVGLAYHLIRQSKRRSSRHTWKAPVPLLVPTGTHANDLDGGSTHSRDYYKSDSNLDSKGSYVATGLKYAPTAPTLLTTPTVAEGEPVHSSPTPFRPLPKPPIKYNAGPSDEQCEDVRIVSPSRSYRVHPPAPQYAGSSESQQHTDASLGIDPPPAVYNSKGFRGPRTPGKKLVLDRRRADDL